MRIPERDGKRGVCVRHATVVVELHRDVGGGIEKLPNFIAVESEVGSGMLALYDLLEQPLEERFGEGKTDGGVGRGTGRLFGRPFERDHLCGARLTGASVAVAPGPESGEGVHHPLHAGGQTLDVIVKLVVLHRRYRAYYETS